MPVILSRKGGGSGGGGGAPSGPAGGALDGTYPNPTLAANAVDAAAIQAGVITQAKMESGLYVPDVFFDSTLGGDAASIDSGAASIPTGYNLIEIHIIARTTEAVDISSVQLTVNNDTGAKYDRQTLRGSNTTASAIAPTLAGANWLLSVPGANQQAGAVGSIDGCILGYSQTTFHKTWVAVVAVPDDTAANNRVEHNGLRFRDTAAITRVTVTANSGNLLAGSRLIVYGR